MQTVAIIGGGLTGSLLSLCLSLRNYKIDVYEKRSDLRVKSQLSKRTIGMSLSARGLGILKKLNLDKEIHKITTPTYGRSIHIDANKINYRNYGKKNQAIYTIKRDELNGLLITAAEETSRVKFNFQTEIKDVDIYSNNVVLANGMIKHYDYIIGADGVNSKIREILVHEKIVRAEVSSLEIGYKQMIIPFSEKNLERFDTSSVHLWTKNKAVFVALPSLGDKSFLANLFMPVDDLLRLDKLTKKEINKFMNVNFDGLNQLVTNFEDQYVECPTSKIYSVNCNKWNYLDKILLVGDASHSIAPFYAMGMNLCFEDCFVIDELFEKEKYNLGDIINLFTSIRKKDTDAMSHMAKSNFNSLCSSKDYSYDQVWNLERKISEIYEEYDSEYSLVAFNNDIPLSQVLAIKESRKKHLLGLLKTANISKNMKH